MKYVTLEEGKDILREIHEGVCGNHAASRTLVGKAYGSGFFWLTVVSDVEDLVRRCHGCQFFGKKTHVPTHNLITIPPSWLFACWSLDMTGPLTIVLTVLKLEIKPSTPASFHNFQTPKVVIGLISNHFHEFWWFLDCRHPYTE
jgi:hypothetical protein